MMGKSVRMASSFSSKDCWVNLTFFIYDVRSESELSGPGDGLGIWTNVEGSDTSDLEAVVDDRGGLSLSFRENNLNGRESAGTTRGEGEHAHRGTRPRWARVRYPF